MALHACRTRPGTQPSVRTPSPAGEEAVRLYNDYSWYVYHFVARVLGNRRVPPEEYEELVHEARVALWRAALSHTGSRSFLPYATAAMRNALVSRARREEREAERLERLVSLDRPAAGATSVEPAALRDVLADPQAEPPEETLVRRDFIARALALLPNERYRKLLLLKIHGYERREIARVLGCSLHSVHNREYRMRRYLEPLRAELRR